MPLSDPPVSEKSRPSQATNCTPPPTWMTQCPLDQVLHDQTHKQLHPLGQDSKQTNPTKPWAMVWATLITQTTRTQTLLRQNPFKHFATCPLMCLLHYVPSSCFVYIPLACMYSPCLLFILAVLIFIFIPAPFVWNTQIFVVQCQ